MRVFDLGGPSTNSVATELQHRSIPDEFTLESLLNANPEMLMSEPVFVFGRQPSVETGIPDLLGLDQYGNVLVFEIKIGDSGSGSASEETILSQPQNYAQSLASYDYEDLNEIYRAYCEDIESGRWEVGASAVPAIDLDDAFESVFGQWLDHAEFNPTQRMVIVAESITRRTQQNARYLLEQGLHLQCMEVQRLESGTDGRAVLATNTVVDYDLSRVRPEREQNPTYPETVSELSERILPEIRAVIGGESSTATFQDVDGYRPHIRSSRPEHPPELKYTLYLRPLEWGTVIVAMDYMGDDDGVRATLRENAGLFEDSGFVVSDRSRDRIVRANWGVESADELESDELLNDVASEFIKLVELGHRVFTGEDEEN